MRLLADWWDKVWPNLVASILWVPATLIHVSRSNRKSLRIYLGDKPGPDVPKEGSTND
jgi:hypothetical protein